MSQPIKYSTCFNQKSRTNNESMRVAIAGSCGLARLIAYYIDQDTSHQTVFLSRSEQPTLLSKGYQVMVINYDDDQSLNFALRGVDTVISTVTGVNQIALLKAAVRARVRRFAPAEFEGLPNLRPAGDPLDRNRTDVLRLLTALNGRLQWTIFICGIFYERFQPGGLQTSLLGGTSGINHEGDYIMDIRNMAAQIPGLSARSQPEAMVCLTALQDVARFVTKAIDLPYWPRELRMYGERVPVCSLVIAVEALKGQSFAPRDVHNPATLRSALAIAAAQRDRARGVRLQSLLATAEGRYDFTSPNLNSMFTDVQTIRFAEWLRRKWDFGQVEARE